MSPTRTFATHLALGLFVLASGLWLWSHHARSWDLGRSASVLAYDPAQYAVAARELADHGRLATLFALPLELATHPAPPWPLALVQPGLVVWETALFKAAGAGHGPAATPAERARRLEWLVIVLPLIGYLAIGVLLAAFVLTLLARHAPGAPPLERTLAAALVALAFLLDPEAQHLAAGGFTEMPFTLGLTAALAMIGLGSAARRPILFGLVLGATGWFRGNMLWIAPLLAITAAASAPAERRLRVLAIALGGYVVLLAPWWFYKWSVFGSAAWDLSWVSIWDGVHGQTWFSLNHLPYLPPLPSGGGAVSAIAVKIARNLATLELALTTGPRGAWLMALLLWSVAARRSSALAVAGAAAFGTLALSVIAAAASVPLMRYLFPARILAECAGVLALWALVSRAPITWMSSSSKRILRVALGVVVLGWGVFQTSRGISDARAGVGERGVPTAESMADLSRRLDRELAPGEPVMSNLGPILAWYDDRPVVHLALSPADLEACRQRLDLRHVLLVFREPERAWPQWIDVLRRPEQSAQNPDWNIARARRFDTADGFLVVWLELGPPRPRIAVVPDATAQSIVTSRRVSVSAPIRTRAR